MSRGRHVRIVLVNQNLAVASGWGSRDLLTELRGRAPAWSNRPRGWAIQPTTARDLVALAELRGYDVTITSAPEGGAA